MLRRRSLLFLALTVTGCPAAPQPDAELEAARAVFLRNIDAIQRKDRAAYLGCYRPDEALIRNGPGGLKLGFAELAAGTSSAASGWPESLEPTHIELRWLAPGVVYGSYAYRVVFSGAASSGISERVFVRRGDRWEIAVTTAFGGPVSSDGTLADLRFLEGTWVEQKDGQWTEESWSLARGGTMLGHGRTLADGKTTSLEHLRIEQLDDGVQLVAMPQGQAATRFRLGEHGAERALFENPEHDFPQRIIYQRDGERLRARIEGGGRSAEWTYQRQ